jgi:hypothetical protein
MLNHARRRASRMLVVPFVASVYLFWECDTRAQSAGDLPMAEEPWLAEPAIGLLILIRLRSRVIKDL